MAGGGGLSPSSSQASSFTRGSAELPPPLAPKVLAKSPSNGTPIQAPAASLCTCSAAAGPYLAGAPAARWGPVDQGLAGAAAGATAQGQDHLGLTGTRDGAPQCPAHRAHVGRLAAGQGLGEQGGDAQRRAPPASSPGRGSGRCRMDMGTPLHFQAILETFHLPAPYFSFCTHFPPSPTAPFLLPSLCRLRGAPGMFL